MGETKKLVHLSLLVAFAMVLYMVEGMLPNPFPLPGAKLGLANIITLVTLILYGFRAALIVAALRTILGSLLGGTFFSVAFFLGFAGAIVSGLVMGVVYRYLHSYLSAVGISILGAIAHNMSQLVVASYLIANIGIFFYLPYLLLFAIPTGYLTGLATNFITRVLRKHFIHVSD